MQNCPRCGYTLERPQTAREETVEFVEMLDRCAMAGDLMPAMFEYRRLVEAVGRERTGQADWTASDDLAWDGIMGWGQAQLKNLYLRETRRAA